MKSAARHQPALLYLIAWLVLVALTGVSLWTAFLGLGIYAPIIEFSIAATQAAIIFILFMRLKGPPSLKWLFAGAGFFWLLFLYGLSTTDYATRQAWLKYAPMGENSRRFGPPSRALFPEVKFACCMPWPRRKPAWS